MTVNRLLLHACCAPDATVPLEELEAEGYNVTLFWYGANIHPGRKSKKGVRLWRPWPGPVP